MCSRLLVLALASSARSEAAPDDKGALVDKGAIGGTHRKGGEDEDKGLYSGLKSWQWKRFQDEVAGNGAIMEGLGVAGVPDHLKGAILDERRPGPEEWSVDSELDLYQRVPRGSTMASLRATVLKPLAEAIAKGYNEACLIDDHPLGKPLWFDIMINDVDVTTLHEHMPSRLTIGYSVIGDDKAQIDRSLKWMSCIKQAETRAKVEKTMQEQYNEGDSENQARISDSQRAAVIRHLPNVKLRLPPDIDSKPSHGASLTGQFELFFSLGHESTADCKGDEALKATLAAATEKGLQALDLGAVAWTQPEIISVECAVVPDPGGGAELTVVHGTGEGAGLLEQEEGALTHPPEKQLNAHEVAHMTPDEAKKTGRWSGLTRKLEGGAADGHAGLPSEESPKAKFFKNKWKTPSSFAAANQKRYKMVAKWSAFAANAMHDKAKPAGDIVDKLKDKEGDVPEKSDYLVDFEEEAKNFVTQQFAGLMNDEYYWPEFQGSYHLESLQAVKVKDEKGNDEAYVLLEDQEVPEKYSKDSKFMTMYHKKSYTGQVRKALERLEETAARLARALGSFKVDPNKEEKDKEIREKRWEERRKLRNAKAEPAQEE